jgi:hypothetical protein
MAQTAMSDSSILETALIGLQHQLTQVDTKIADIRRKLGVRAPRVSSTTVQAEGPRKQQRRKLSAAARKRIGEATRKRWAEFRAKKAKSGGRG